MVLRGLSLRAARRVRQLRSLNAIGTARKVLNGVAIVVSRGKIHRAEVASVAKNFVDQTYALKELLPIECGHQAHTRDDIAHGDAHGRLVLMLGTHDFVGG